MTPEKSVVRFRACRVPQCYNSLFCSIPLHRFPIKNVALCKKWMSILKMQGPISKYTSICSAHFSDRDFFPVRPNQRRLLKRGAFPSKNIPLSVDKHAMEIRESKKSADYERSIRNGVQKQKPLPSIVEKTVQDKQEIVNRSDPDHKTATNQNNGIGQSAPLPKKKLRSAPKEDSNDGFDPLDLNNLLLSTTSILKGMCSELLMNQNDYSNLDKERITVKTSGGGGKEESLQIVILNKKTEEATPSCTDAANDLEKMLDDVENVVSTGKSPGAKDINTVSTQTDNTNLEEENKKLRMEIALLKNRILTLQGQLQVQNLPKLLYVCNNK